MARVKSSCSLNEKRQRMKEFEEKHFQNVQQRRIFDDRSSNVTSLYHSDQHGDAPMVRVKRPATRRHPSDIPPPPRERLKPRSLSDGKLFSTKTKTGRKLKDSTRKSSKGSDSSAASPVNKTKGKKKTNSETSSIGTESPIELIEENNKKKSVETSPVASAKKKGTGDGSNRNNKVEEHEYLQFLLRVTEDIILNNYYLNEDIERVFIKHIEMNKDMLSREKMEQHIAKLANELNMANLQSNVIKAINENYNPLSKPSYTNVQTLKTCGCEYSPDIPMEMYMYPSSNDYNYYNQTFQNNLDEIIFYRHSLGRVTECTEPSNSSTTITKGISACPSKSDKFLENSELDIPYDKLYNTRSEILKIKRNDSEDSLLFTKAVREILSDNIIRQPYNPNENEKIEENKENPSNKDQNTNIITERTSGKEISTEKDNCLTYDAIKKSDKFVNVGSKSEDIDEIEKSDSNTEKSDFNTEIEVLSPCNNDAKKNTINSDKNINTDVLEKCTDNFNIEENYDDKFNTEKNELNSETGNVISEEECNSNVENSTTNTENNLDKFKDNDEIFRTNKPYQENNQLESEKIVTNESNQSTTRDANTEYSGSMPEKNNVDGENSDVNTDLFDDPIRRQNSYKFRFHQKRSKFSTGKNIQVGSDTDLSGFTSDIKAEIGDYNIEKVIMNADKSSFNTEKGDFKVESAQEVIQPNHNIISEANDFNANKDFNLQEYNKVFELDLRLDLDDKYSVEITSDSKESIKTNPSEENKSEGYNSPDFVREISKSDKNIRIDVDKSMQTSYHNLCTCNKKCDDVKPNKENKSTQMSPSSPDKEICSDATPTNSDYVLITSPIYVLRSALNSNNKLVIKKDKFPSVEDLYEPDSIERQSDIESDAYSLDMKLLGSDYDFTPERDTSDNYPSLVAEVPSTISRLRIPSLSSIQEENLLLGNLYDLNSVSSRRYEMHNEWEFGSATYRCLDKATAVSCDDDIFLRNSEIIVSKNWLSDTSERRQMKTKKRLTKLKHVAANVNFSNSISSTSSTC